MTTPRRSSSKMTPERVEAICEQLLLGYSRSVAAAEAGVTKDSLRRWMEKHPWIAERVEMAEGVAQARLLTIIRDAARLPQNWTAAAWLLERRWPDAYGQRQRVEIALDVREEAKRIAEELGLDEREVLAEAEAIIAKARQGGVSTP